MNYPLRMSHPNHGATHVYNGLQEEQHRKNGWLSDEEYAERQDEGPQSSISSPVKDQSLDRSAPTLEQVRAMLTERGIPFDKRLGLEKLKALL